MLNNKRILVTGSTGSFGHHFVDYVFKHYNTQKSLFISVMNSNSSTRKMLINSMHSLSQL